MAWQQPNWMQQMPAVHNPSLNVAAAAATTTPMVPEAYATLQYPNATAEQQYALQQQNWNQWQTYQQQYAQWQAQYGEQYQRELQQKMGVPAPIAMPIGPVQAPAPLPPPTSQPSPPPPPPDPEPIVRQNVAVAFDNRPWNQQTAPPPSQQLYQNIAARQGQQNVVAAPTAALHSVQGNNNYVGNSVPVANAGAGAVQQQPVINDSGDGEKSAEELAFDEQFRNWENEFTNWKQQNLNHPDRKAYMDYEEKMEQCRNKLLERREQMRRRKIDKNASTALASNAPPVSATQHESQLNQNALNLKDPEPNDHQQYGFGMSSQNKHSGGIVADYDARQSNYDLNDGSNFMNNFPVSSQTSSGGIPGLDLIEEKKSSPVKPGRREKKTDVIDLEADNRQVSADDAPAVGADNNRSNLAEISKGINTILGDPNLISLLSNINRPASSSNDIGLGNQTKNSQPVTPKRAFNENQANRYADINQSDSPNMQFNSNMDRSNNMTRDQPNVLNRQGDEYSSNQQIGLGDRFGNRQSNVGDVLNSQEGNNFNRQQNQQGDRFDNENQFQGDHFGNKLGNQDNRFNQQQNNAGDRFNQPSNSAGDRFNQPPNNAGDQFNPQQNSAGDRFNQPPNNAGDRFNPQQNNSGNIFNQPPNNIGDRFNPQQNNSGNQFNQPPNPFNQPPNNIGDRFIQQPNNAGDRFGQPPNIAGDQFNQTPNNGGDRFNPQSNNFGNRFNQQFDNSGFNNQQGGNRFNNHPNDRFNQQQNNFGNRFANQNDPFSNRNDQFPNQNDQFPSQNEFPPQFPPNQNNRFNNNRNINPFAKDSDTFNNRQNRPNANIRNQPNPFQNQSNAFGNDESNNRPERSNSFPSQHNSPFAPHIDASPMPGGNFANPSFSAQPDQGMDDADNSNCSSSNFEARNNASGSSGMGRFGDFNRGSNDIISNKKKLSTTTAPMKTFNPNNPFLRKPGGSVHSGDRSEDGFGGGGGNDIDNRSFDLNRNFGQFGSAKNQTNIVPTKIIDYTAGSDPQFFKPKQIIDYNPSANGSAAYSAPNTKVVDYGHKATSTGPKLSGNISNMRIIDYGHQSSLDQITTKRKQKFERNAVVSKKKMKKQLNKGNAPAADNKSQSEFDVLSDDDSMNAYPNNNFQLINADRTRPGLPTKRGKRKGNQNKLKYNEENSTEPQPIVDTVKPIEEAPAVVEEVVKPPPVKVEKPKPKPYVRPRAVPVPVEPKNVIDLDDILLEPGRKDRPQKIVVIMRGPPGSGKTYLAKQIKDKEVEMSGSTVRILSIDDYFTTETDEIVTCPETGKKITNKILEYVYDAAMEDTYMQYLVKSFKKTVTDGHFDFIIVDCVNSSLKYYTEMYNFAKTYAFTPYTCEMERSTQTCVRENIHNRSEEEIIKIVDNWSNTPEHYLKLDYFNFIS